MKTAMMLCLICLACAGGCAGRTVGAGTLSLVSVPALREDSFAALVAAQPEGSMQYFPDSPFGPATVGAGTFYLSGLGNECRSVRITVGSISQKVAICREENGLWHFIPTIFECLPQ